MSKEKDKQKSKDPFSFFGKKGFFWILGCVAILYLFMVPSSLKEGRVRDLTYSDFYKMLVSGEIQVARRSQNVIRGLTVRGTKYRVRADLQDPHLIMALRENVLSYSVEPSRTLIVNLLYSLGPMILFILFLWFFVYRNMNSGGNRIFSFGKSRATRGDKDQTVTFADVAGVDEAVEELREVVEFLKYPKKFEKLGGKIPKGVLLVGPPGGGKTLLAKAIAGEADVPFFSISASDFCEMFVGVGAARVRDLFLQAKKEAVASGKGAIIFVDEIDAIGRKRMNNISGGNDEREQALNALLVEMDGFHGRTSVIVIAATNRPDVLDSALLRPGRFDRHVSVGKPDIRGREAILKIHTRKVRLSSSVDLGVVARQSVGLSGADLANLVNEAALLAARRSKKSIDQSELDESFERIVAGLQKKHSIMGEKERRIVSYHECGHAVVAALIDDVDPVHKVSIIPRGSGALGYTMQLPENDRYLQSKNEFLGRICVLLGGRIAEEIFFGDITSGAYDDLQKATDIAKRMVCLFGMSEQVGTLHLRPEEGAFGTQSRWYSEKTAEKIDHEVSFLIKDSAEKVRKMILEYKPKLSYLAETLLKEEVLEGRFVEQIVLGDLPVDLAPSC